MKKLSVITHYGLKMKSILGLLFFMICTFNLFAQDLKPLDNKKDNSAKIRQLLQDHKMDDAILFTDECIKKGEDKEFYLGWKLTLLDMLKQTEKAIECALLLDKAGGQKKVDPASKLAELYLTMENKAKTLYWMAQAADRGLKDQMFLESESWPKYY